MSGQTYFICQHFFFWIPGILILQYIFFVSNSICNILCFQATEWKQVNRSLTWGARLSSKLEQTTNWWKPNIRTFTYIVCKLDLSEALVSVFLMLYCLKSVLLWLTLLLLFILFLSSHMNNNSISGQIPPELSKLPNLLHL